LPDMVFIFAMITIVLLISVIPIIYSYRFYKKRVSSGKFKNAEELAELKKRNKKYFILTVIIIAVVAVFFVFISFTGEIDVEYGEDSFKVSATYSGSLTVDYSDITKVELCEGVKAGQKVMGLNSPRLLLGSYKNSEYGIHTRYTYTKCDLAVVLDVSGKTVVINGETPAETILIYTAILEAVEG